MGEIVEKKPYKTHQIWVKKGHRMYAYFQEMCVNGKNMYNTTNFFIRQVYTGLKTEKKRQPLQQEVLELIEKYLPKMNEVQIAAYQRKVERQKWNPKKNDHAIKPTIFEKPTREKPYVSYAFLDALFKAMQQNDYRALPTQASQGIMKRVFQNWQSFFASLMDYKQHPSKYKARPKIPRYSRAQEKEILFTNQDCVVKDQTYLKFPKTKEQLNIGKVGSLNRTLKQVRVIPKYGSFVVELVMEAETLPKEKPSKQRLLSLDLGIDNLAAITTNTGRKPELVKGKRIKSINQYYNKVKAHVLGILRHGKETGQRPFTSKRLERLHQKRQLKIKDIFHKTSSYIVKVAVEEDIDTIVIGSNKDWKQHVNMGKQGNQSFTSIPHRLLIQMITYKAAEHGIRVMETEESYTSKASFIDGDDISVYEKGKKYTFSGKRIKRGLYRSERGYLVNADINGSANILKKYWQKTFKDTLNMETVHVWEPKIMYV